MRLRIKDKLSGIPSSVIVFGAVSFLTDFSSDMVYPLLPVFLTGTLGAGQLFVGLVEGAAETTAALFKFFSGVWADRVKDRSKLVLLGYSLSSLSRPFIAAAQSAWTVFGVRFADRVGKGIRSSPRDAIVADVVAPSKRGFAYGIQRAMDHAGAVTGPLVATLLLTFWVKDLRTLFWIASIPGFLAVALIVWKVRDVPAAARTFSRHASALKLPSRRLRIYLAIMFFFILSCSSDAFLLLRASELGVPPALLPILWIVLNGVMMLTTAPLGALSDRIGRRRTILLGWSVYIAVYLGFAFAESAWQAWVLFAVYGLFYALTEPAERALLADYAEPGETGRAFGWYHLIVGLGSLPASLLFGAVWQTQHSHAAFMMSAGISSAAALCLWIFLRRVPSTLRPATDRRPPEASGR